MTATSEPRGLARNHQPDLPFGCWESWGPYVFPPGRGLWSDMQLHTCNSGCSGHAGPCRCKCGDVLVPESESVL